MVEQISDGFEGSQIIKSHKNTSRRYYLKAETLLLYNTGTSKDNDQNEHKKVLLKFIRLRCLPHFITLIGSACLRIFRLSHSLLLLWLGRLEILGKKHPV